MGSAVVTILLLLATSAQAQQAPMPDDATRICHDGLCWKPACVRELLDAGRAWSVTNEPRRLTALHGIPSTSLITRQHADQMAKRETVEARLHHAVAGCSK